MNQDKNPKYDYVLISASTMLNMKIWLVEGLETAAIWFLPSCALKYLDPTGQSPCSHRLTMKISSVFLTDSTVFYKVIMPFRIPGVLL